MSDLSLPKEESEVPDYESTEDRPRLSLTSDVLDFRKCQRKYGLYKIRGFDDSSLTSEYVGTFSHRAIEEAWQHYNEHGTAPTKSEIITILEDIREALLEEGRTPHSWSAVFHAGYQVLRFLATMDSLDIYSKIVDSERTLRSSNSDYILEGVVDLILEVDQGFILWDFKSAQDPREVLLNSDSSPRSKRAAERMLSDYTLQLQLYHYLCESVLEETPTRCNIVFLGELGRGDVEFGKYEDISDAWRDCTIDPVSRNKWQESIDKSSDENKHGLLYSVNNSADDVQNAIAEFESTAQDIIKHREKDYWPEPDPSDLPSEQTCKDCDFYDSCETAKSYRETE